MFYELIPWSWESLHAPARKTERTPLETFDRLFDNFFNDFDLLRLGGQRGVSAGALFQPEIKDTEKEIVISANLPGVEEKDLKVSLDDHAITIEGLRKDENEVETPNGKRLESTSHTFLQTIPLPDEIDSGKVEATLQEGELKLTIPKQPKAEEKVHNINIEHN